MAKRGPKDRKPVTVVPDAKRLDPAGVAARALRDAKARKASGTARPRKSRPAQPQPAVDGMVPHRGRKRRKDKSTAQYYTTQPGPLTPNGHTYHRGHDEAVRTLTTEVRRSRAVELLVVDQLSYAQIAELLGVTAKTVADDLRLSFEALQEQRLENIEHRRMVEIQRTERADRALLPGLQAKDARVRNQTSDSLRANAEFRARLDGLYAKNDGAWSADDVASLVLGFTRELLAEFTDTEQQRRIHRIYARRAAMSLPDIQQPQQQPELPVPADAPVTEHG